MSKHRSNKHKIKLLFLAPPFHGHARPLWQLACELQTKPHFDCLFLDCFSKAIDYPGDVVTHRIKTLFNEQLLSASQNSQNLDVIKLVSENLAGFYNEISKPLEQLLEHFQPDILISDYFFSYGQILAEQFNKPYFVTYSSPDLFFIDQDETNLAAKMEVMMEQKKYQGYQQIMMAHNEEPLNSFSLSPFGNFCFTPDLIKKYNPSAFANDILSEQGICWQQFHSFFDDKHYPLLAVNHATPKCDSSTEDYELIEYLSDENTVSVLISFGTVWLRQLGDAKTETAFITILRHLLVATNHTRYRIVYSGDNKYLQQAMEDLVLSSTIVQKNYINQSYLIQFADLFVFHGGYNSFCEAMAGKTPMLIFPKGFDQGRIANLACLLGVGERIPFSSNTENLVTKKIQQLSDEPHYQSNSDDLHHYFKRTLDIDSIDKALHEAVN